MNTGRLCLKRWNIQVGVERDVAGGSGKSRVRVDLYLEHKLVLSCEELQAIFDRLLAEGIPRVSGGAGKSGKYAIIVA